jgi:hypothetical protein
MKNDKTIITARQSIMQGNGNCGFFDDAVPVFISKSRTSIKGSS